jgi:hypothetical protein
MFGWLVCWLATSYLMHSAFDNPMKLKTAGDKMLSIQTPS